jgi:hypothetical protein
VQEDAPLSDIKMDAHAEGQITSPVESKVEGAGARPSITDRADAVSFAWLRSMFAPCSPPVVQAVQSRPVGGGSQGVQIEVRSGDRGVSHPRVHRDRIDSASEPETGCGMA